jgi:hypothetical protein
MLPQNDYLVKRELLDYRAEALESDARQRRLLSRAGRERRPWLSCQICHALWHLGRGLVAAGQQLEKRYAVPTVRSAQA